MKKDSSACIYACSHRAGGNSDYTATLLAQGIEQAGGSATIHYVRDSTIRPCLACGACDVRITETKKRCVLHDKDDATQLFSPLFSASVVLFAAPIYFYHLPSLCKTWLDRSQQFWKASSTNEPWLDLPSRKAWSVLMAGRPVGEKLFDGAQLSLKYFSKQFRFEMQPSLTFHGIDAPLDMKKSSDAKEAILRLGERAWLEK